MVSGSAPQEDGDAVPIWDYVPLDMYQPPAQPVIYTARRLAVVRDLFRRRRTTPAVPIKAADDLYMLSSDQLDQIAPAVDWATAAAALDTALAPWLDCPAAEQPLRLLVAPPHSGLASILCAWARRHTWPILQPPAPQQILNHDETWLDAQLGVVDGRVVPCLEKTYLRHNDGLGLFRRFLDRIATGELGRVLIGCDSWAWILLQRIWRGPLPAPITLQAFDSARLIRSLPCLARSATDRPLRFRQSNTGQDVVPPPPSADATAPMNDFLRFLAAYSRGSLGIAHAIWRASLRTEPDVSLMEEPGNDEEHPASQTIWVTAWEHLTFPAVPTDTGFAVALVLHALLLHNGVPVDVLCQIMPLSPDQMLHTLFRLEQAGLVTGADGTCRVTPMGYPVVRAFLQAHDYPVDSF